MAANQPAATRIERERVRIIMLGDSDTGKTEFCNCFKTKAFSGILLATIGVELTSVEVDLCDNRLPLTIDLYDTAGQERYGGMIARSYYRPSRGAIIVFDPSDDKSLTRAVAFFKDVTAERPNIVVTFVANKIDLLMKQNDKAYCEARYAKLKTLLESAYQSRPASPDNRPIDLNMGVHFVSLLEKPEVAFDIACALAQKIAFNAIRLRINAERTGTPTTAVAIGAPTVKLKRLDREAAARAAAEAKKKERTWCF